MTPVFNPRICTWDECDRRIKAARARMLGRGERINKQINNMEIKRYDLVTKTRGYDSFEVMEYDATGEYAIFEDVEKLIADHARAMAEKERELNRLRIALERIAAFNAPDARAMIDIARYTLMQTNGAK